MLLDHVVGCHSDDSSRSVYDILNDKYPPRHVADLELVLDVNKSSVNFHPVPF